MVSLVGRKRQAVTVGQSPDIDSEIWTHGFSPKLSAIRVTSAAATSSLLIAGQELTATSAPRRVSRWIVLRSPPMTPVAGETSLATIQSQPLRASFVLALSIRFSVSAANPITSGGRRGLNPEKGARMSGFFTNRNGGTPTGGFFCFFSPLRGPRPAAP